MLVVLTSLMVPVKELKETVTLMFPVKNAL